ncbi:helix-turn-helix domain-containing protein [Lactobacillus melliventris]|nr:helix-turn-helix domain-containing protein [Lactobacillus melliventris]
MYGLEQQQIRQQASEMFTKALAVYEDAKIRAPKLKNPKYAFFNKTNAAIYLGISTPTLDNWIKEYRLPFISVDGVRRFAKEDLDEFMMKHKKYMG